MSSVLTAKQLKIVRDMSLTSFYDVVSYFPYKYDDFALDLYLDSYHHDNSVTIKGTVISQPVSKSIKAKLTKINFVVLVGNDEYDIVCFNRSYLMNALSIGKEVIIQGKYNHFKREILLSKITMDIKKEDTLSPVYRLKDVTSYEYSSIVKKSFDEIKKRNGLKNLVPDLFMDKYKLSNKYDAYYSMHFPTSYESIKQAKRYLKYEELLVYSLTLLMNRERMLEENKSDGKKVNKGLIDTFIRSLPYKLTNDQYNASIEIVRDIESSSNMYRLLQGDVGSGKTVVSAIALLACASSSHQAALMAPTDILAQQHYNSISNMFKGIDVNVALLVSSMPSREKKLVKEKVVLPKV